METITTVMTNLVELLASGAGAPIWLSWTITILVVATTITCSAIMIGWAFIKMIPAVFSLVGMAGICIAAMFFVLWLDSVPAPDWMDTPPKAEEVHSDELSNNNSNIYK
jgi:hypothetical protein